MKVKMLTGGGNEFKCGDIIDVTENEAELFISKGWAIELGEADEADDDGEGHKRGRGKGKAGGE